MAADMSVASQAYMTAATMGASEKVLLALFEAGIVESGFRNLNYGDRDSVGYLQQRPSQGWPDPMNIQTATRSFVSRAMAKERANPNLTAGQLAQSVQVSAFPEKYDKVEGQARSLLASLTGGGLGGGIGQTLPVSLGGVDDLADRALTGAKNLLLKLTGGALGLALVGVGVTLAVLPRMRQKADAAGRKLTGLGGS